MTNRYLSREEKRLVRESLVTYIAQTKGDLSNRFEDGLYRMEKLHPHVYDTALETIKILNHLYKELDGEGIDIQIIREENIK
jgi:hypothetical protein